MATSASPLRIGGTAVWPEWFAGRIDEVRVYNRAQTAAEIQADMGRAVAAPPAAARRGRLPRARRVRGRGGWMPSVRAPRVASLRSERRRRGLPLRNHAQATRRQQRLTALRRAGEYAAYRAALRRR
jgi:hypothetical protein